MLMATGIATSAFWGGDRGNGTGHTAGTATSIVVVVMATLDLS
jgi:hypothetical protein